MAARKRKTAVFRRKLHFTSRKSATKFRCVNTVSDEVVRHSLAYLAYLCKSGALWTSPTV